MNRLIGLLRRSPAWRIALWVAVLGLPPLVVYVVPILLVGDADLTAEQRIKATNEARTSLAQIIAAAGLFGTLLLTARTFLLSLTGQVTSRFEAGIKQLGDISITVRIGGVYGLEQLDQRRPRNTPVHL